VNLEYHIVSDNGDQYSLSLSSDGLSLSDEIRDAYGIELISIELMRIQGNGVTSSKTLACIEQIIADVFDSFPNAVLFYYCDFLNTIPSTTKHISPQEYRSRLFSDMFQRYVSHHDITGVSEVVVTIDGEEEPYFIHMIAREQHLSAVQKIGDQLRRDFEK